MLGNPYYLGNTSLIPNSDIPIPKTVQSLGLRQMQNAQNIQQEHIEDINLDAVLKQ